MTIQPPAGSALYIGYHYHTIDGLLVLNQLADGSIDMTATGTADFGQILLPTLGGTFRLGDDFGSAVVRLRGALQFR